MSHRTPLNFKTDRGVTMIEVLVTIVILTVGLLGLAGLQGRAFNAEMESHQRGQAIILLQDMADRISNNPIDPGSAGNYVTASSLGTGVTDLSDCTTGASRVAIDQCEWSKALKGASESVTTGGTTTKVGAMINGRGCIHAAATPNTYLISVVWQGKSSTVIPSTTCGSGSYDSENTRRAVTTVVRVANLTGN